MEIYSSFILSMVLWPGALKVGEGRGYFRLGMVCRSCITCTLDLVVCGSGGKRECALMFIVQIDFRMRLGKSEVPPR